MEIGGFETVQITVLAIIQGLTEFLPISSSGHLILPSLLFGWPDQGLTFDVAVHVGSLGAVIFYFRHDISILVLAWLRSLVTRVNTAESRLAWLIILATLPAGVAGLILNDYVETYTRALAVIAATSIIFAILLFWADASGTRDADLKALTWRGALVIGCAQILSLIPGTSRSGVTMTAALFCNLTRTAAARFSFLLSIPIIMATGLLKGVELASSPDASIQWFGLLYGVVLSGLVAYACIHYFLQLIDKIGFLPFVIYRIALGILLFTVYFVG